MNCGGYLAAKFEGMEEIVSTTPYITNDAVVFGLLMSLLALVFYTSKHPAFAKFYRIIPGLLLCYFLPSLMNTFGLISPAWIDLVAAKDHLASLGFDISAVNTLHDLKVLVSDNNIPFSELKSFTGSSKLYFMASRYLLPASLVLLTLSIDMKEVVKLGPKALIMFFAATLGVIIGGPIALSAVGMVSPDTVGGEGANAVWRGMTTIAGSWIGGGANQAAMFEIFSPSSKLYSIMITVDVLVAEVWMALLLLGVGRKDKIDKFLKADSSAVDHLQEKMHEFANKTARIPSFNDMILILGIAFAATGFSHFLADIIAPWIEEHAKFLETFSLTSGFFWLIVLATTIGLLLSFTKARNFEGAGASKFGSVFIYILVATIGMKMNVLEIFDNPGLFVVGLIWMAVHVGVLVVVAKLIKAPYFFLAVGSKANIGGAASAPVVAAAFHPSLAPVGVLLAVLGYALGTYGAYLSGLMMQWLAG